MSGLGWAQQIIRVLIKFQSLRGANTKPLLLEFLLFGNKGDQFHSRLFPSSPIEKDIVESLHSSATIRLEMEFKGAQFMKG